MKEKLAPCPTCGSAERYRYGPYKRSRIKGRYSTICLACNARRGREARKRDRERLYATKGETNA